VTAPSSSVERALTRRERHGLPRPEREAAPAAEALAGGRHGRPDRRLAQVDDGEDSGRVSAPRRTCQHVV